MVCLFGLQTMVIDSRSFLEYNTSNVQQSVNVCCSKLVKRRLQQDKVPPELLFLVFVLKLIIDPLVSLLFLCFIFFSLSLFPFIHFSRSFLLFFSGPHFLLLRLPSVILPCLENIQSFTLSSFTHVPHTFPNLLFCSFPPLIFEPLRRISLLIQYDFKIALIFS